ncbi:hypothetical protein [Bradyrhizobium elkanii]|uniref:hypothetical protein n=1 Tax=Bradyrhizobium elkanii TaxID=29448 RepID=UPI00272A3209|nr:hypothetical protein [Bradyrhizobium elkanii]WLA79542.1 hypothetical protein QNJ99_29595 [Bradyrhizobium elkanii]
MARGFLKIYRTYSYLTKNPVIDKMRTVLQEEGMYSKKQRQVLHELSGVGVQTFENGFEGDVRNPRHETIMATMSSLGYEEQFVKAKTIDVEAERKAAAAWQEKQNKLKEKAAPAKTNGRRKPRKSKR